MDARISLIFVAMPALMAATYDPRPDLEAGHYLRTLAEAEAVLQADPANALAWAAKSQALTSQQRCKEGLVAAEQALALSPGLADATMARGLARVGLALQQRNLGSVIKAKAAIADLEAATQADPRLANAWMTLGLAYQHLPKILGGSPSRALECAEKLRLIAPARGELLSGMVLALAGRWQEAELRFDRALALAPADPEIVYGYLDTLDSRKAREHFGRDGQKLRQAAEARRLLPAVSTRAKALEAITDALLEAGQPEEAWRIATAALAQADAPSLVRLQLGKLSARSGLHQQEGLAYLDQVLREPLEGGSAGYPGALWRRGQILKAQGRGREAKVAAEAALKLDPMHPGAKKLLAGS